MLIEQLKRELRKLLDNIKEYKSLDAEARTAERREQNTADINRIKELEVEIREAEEMDEIEERMNASVNLPPLPSLNQRSGIEIPDAPIYRSAFPLGEQMRDIVLAGNMDIDRDVRMGARDRLQQVEKRALVRHGITNVEDRAAGTGGMVEAVGQDGGFLLQGETALDLFTKGFNNNAILSRTDNRTMSSQKLEIVGVKEESRADGSRGGGVRVYTDKELGQMTQSKTKFHKIAIEPKKLTGLYFASDEILEDVPALQGEMSSLFNEDFQFKAQDLVLNGSGSGEPLGIFNCGAIVTQAKETSQTADTVNGTNISKMFARVWMRSLGSLVWVCNQDVSPQLDALAYSTTATNSAVYVPSANPGLGSIGTLKGLPVIPVEQCATVGDLNDIALLDLSQYITANRGGINSAMSIHLKFDYNQTAFRFTYRFDGQPRWASALTPYKGSNTVSPFVNLAARA